MANLINPHVKRRVRPADFLPKKEKPTPLPSVEAREAALEAALSGRDDKRAKVVQQAESLKAFIEKRKKKG